MVLPGSGSAWVFEHMVSGWTVGKVSFLSFLLSGHKISGFVPAHIPIISPKQPGQSVMNWHLQVKVYEPDIDTDKPSSLCAAMFYALKLWLGDAILRFPLFLFIPLG